MSLIGKQITITASPNATLVGMEGEVYDESKTMLVLETRAGKKTVLKSSVKIQCGETMVDGCDLLGLPHDRLKR